ncbi:MAG TPA: M23 family metallopeptidase [Armatimonadetes bacterium]|jgi:murein DD-endopeptidase MepM/ murein hydrolase activator NlpD|nr:M23 family metallopeptidase [Armatimonadota bacterium]
MRLLRKHSCPTRGVHRCLAPRAMPAVLIAAVALAPAHAADQTPKLSPTTVPQGGLVRVTYRLPEGRSLEKASLVFGNTKAQCFPHQGVLTGLLGVSARARTGKSTAALWIRYQDGSHDKFPLTLTVTSANFPTQRIRMPGSKTGLMSPEILKKEREILNEALASTTPEPLWEGVFTNPLEGRISSPFGRKRYVNGRFWGFHSGRDVASPAGRPVKAANAGRVTLARKLWMRGNTVAIDHGMGVFTLYEHLSRISVTPGQQIDKGEVVGLVGSTGFSTGPHLHWELRIHGVPTNPAGPLREGIALEP